MAGWKRRSRTVGKQTALETSFCTVRSANSTQLSNSGQKDNLEIWERKRNHRVSMAKKKKRKLASISNDIMANNCQRFQVSSRSTPQGPDRNTSTSIVVVPTGNSCQCSIKSNSSRGKYYQFSRWFDNGKWFLSDKTLECRKVPGVTVLRALLLLWNAYLQECAVCTARVRCRR